MDKSYIQGQRPAILVVCTPPEGHVTPMLQIAAFLISRNYDVWFLTSEAWRERVQRIGANFIPSLKAWNSTGVKSLYKSILSDLSSSSRDELWTKHYNSLFKAIWVQNIPSSLESIRRAMTVVRQAIGPERDVVMIVETWVPGIIPLKLGAELPWGYTKPPKTLGISVIPPQIFSVEQGPTLPGPINSGLAGNIGIPHYDSSGSSQEAIHARNVLLARLCSAAFAPTWDDLRFVLRMCGASEDFNTIFDSDTCIPQIPSNLGFLCHDTTLQMCVPSLEYRSTSWPKHVKFGGTLPRKTLDVTFDRPVWLDEVRQQGRQGSKKKKVVFTTQGTMAVDYSMCILPTIMGLSDREDIIVIAVLGVKGESLEQAPSNAIVLDYFPYDPILELADVVVTNGSYGIFSQCALHGVPMVLAGAFSEDKPEVCNRAEYSGIGLYIRSSWPRPEEIAAGVNKVLETDKYVKRAAEISAEIEEFKCLDTVERELRKLF